jgi:hypothetical protein
MPARQSQVSYKAKCRTKGPGYLGQPWDYSLARAGVRGLSAGYMLRAEAAGPQRCFGKNR